MKYIMDHEEYDSNGYELYDFCGENVNVQFGKINALLREKNKIVYLPSKRRKLAFPPYERLKAKYFPNGVDESVKYSKFVESMAPILQTSAYMLEQLISGSIKVSLSEGNIIVK